MKITLRQLQIFAETAKHENISLAAEKLFISQSAASMSLAQLESQLNIKLFFRQGKKLILNETGAELLAKASNILSQVKEIECYTSQENTLQGNIHIAASSTIANHFLPKLLNKFIQKHPHVNIQLTQGNTDECIAALSKLKVDFALIEGSHPHPHISLSNWRNDEMTIFCSPKHPLAKQKFIALRSLAKYPWILREEGSGTRRIVETNLQQHHIPFKTLAVLHGSIAIKNFIRENTSALSCLSSTVIADDIKIKKLVPLKIKNWKLSGSLYLATYKNKELSVLDRLFLKV